MAQESHRFIVLESICSRSCLGPVGGFLLRDQYCQESCIRTLKDNIAIYWVRSRWVKVCLFFNYLSFAAFDIHCCHLFMIIITTCVFCDNYKHVAFYYIWTLMDISHSIGMFYRIPKKLNCSHDLAFLHIACSFIFPL